MSKSSQIIQITGPKSDCPLSNNRPKFSWRLTTKIDRHLKVSYGIKLVEIKEKRDFVRQLKNRRKSLVTGITRTYFSIPKNEKPLKENRAYAFQVFIYDERGKIFGYSDIAHFYLQSACLPFKLADLYCCDSKFFKTGFSGWKKARNSPQIWPGKAAQFGQKGVIEMEGHLNGGDAIYYQSLAGRLKEGKYYKVSFCVRVKKEQTSIRFRVIAFNGDLADDQTYPGPSSSIQIISETHAFSSTEWTQFMPFSWRAPRDFEHLGIIALTDDPTSRYGEISNICFKESKGCSGATIDIDYDKKGRIKLPKELKKCIDKDAPITPIPHQTNHGRLVDMYGSMFDEGGQANWYPTDPCVSIGGKVPEGIMEETLAQEPEYFDGQIPQEDYESIEEELNDLLGHIGDLSGFAPIPTIDENPGSCRGITDRLPDNSKPFGGRDIIYVHGFQSKHVLGEIKNSLGITVEGVERRWPVDNISTDDYYGKDANDYWKGHIQKFLTHVEDGSIALSNRYLIISYNCNQRLVDNVHAMLTQIRNAMNDGTGVIFDAKDPREGACFGRNCVVVSHSTGALLTNAALALAKHSHIEDARNNDEIALGDEYTWLSEFIGDVSYISDRVDTHVSMHGAIAGSGTATLAMVSAHILHRVAQPLEDIADTHERITNAVDSTYLPLNFIPIETPWERFKNSIEALGFDSDLYDMAIDITENSTSLASVVLRTVNNSVLVDLMPLVSKSLWGAYFRDFPVPVLTVAGALPLINPILPGFDDTIISTNSQSGMRNSGNPSTYLFDSPNRIFDPSLPKDRAAGFFINQYKGTNETGLHKAAYASFPNASPWGMVQPIIGGVDLTNDRRYDNHFTFLQSASDHGGQITEPKAVYDIFGLPVGSVNYEETLAITRSNIFDNIASFRDSYLENPSWGESPLVSPQIAEKVIRSTRGVDLVITFYLPRFEFLSSFPFYSIELVSFPFVLPIWRRTFDHLLATDQLYPWPEAREIAIAGTIAGATTGAATAGTIAWKTGMNIGLSVAIASATGAVIGGLEAEESFWQCFLNKRLSEPGVCTPMQYTHPHLDWERMREWKNLQECDYVYQYVLREIE